MHSYMETAVLDRVYQPEYAAQQEVVEADPFADMMQAEFGPDFGAQVGAPALEGNVQLSEAEIDAEVAKFAAELNRSDAASEDAQLSDFDRNFLNENGMTWRAMTAEELAQVEANERRARVAAFNEFAFQQMVLFGDTDSDKKKKSDD